MLCNTFYVQEIASNSYLSKSSSKLDPFRCHRDVRGGGQRFLLLAHANGKVFRGPRAEEIRLLEVLLRPCGRDNREASTKILGPPDIPATFSRICLIQKLQSDEVRPVLRPPIMIHPQGAHDVQALPRVY